MIRLVLVLFIISVTSFSQTNNENMPIKTEKIDDMFAVDLNENNAYTEYGENKQSSGCTAQGDILDCKFNKSFKVANKTLDAEAKAELNKVIDEIKAYFEKNKVTESSITVHGNASYITYSGGNEQLAKDRADVVLNYLKEQLSAYKIEYKPVTSAVSGPPYETAKAGKYTNIQMEEFYKHQYVSMKVDVLKKEPTKPPGSFACGDVIKVNGKGSSGYCGIVDNGKGYTAAIYVKGAKKITLTADAYQVPDRFVLEYDGKIIKDTDYISTYFQPGKVIELIDSNAVEAIRKDRKAQVKAYLDRLNTLSKATTIGKNDFIPNFYGVAEGKCSNVSAGFINQSNFDGFRECVKNGTKFYTANISINTSEEYEAIMPSYMNRSDKGKNGSESNPHNELIEEIKDRISYPTCEACGTNWKNAVKKTNSNSNAQPLAREIYLNGVKEYVVDFFSKGFREIDPKEEKSVKSYARYKELIDRNGCGTIAGKSPEELILDGNTIQNGKDDLAYLKVYAPLVNMTVWTAKVVCE